MSTGKDTPQRHDMRLLPWTSDTGKPCYVPLTAEGGPVSAIADAVEGEQVADARAVLAEAESIWRIRCRGARAAARARRGRSACSGAPIRVAESRGQRLGLLDPDEA